MRAMLSLLLAALSLASFGQVDPALFAPLDWRLVGPFRGGRSNAVAGAYEHPQHFYMGATGGGLWKTEDGGDSWVNVGDGFLGTSSVGAIAVAPSDDDIVYVGMGETEIRGNISHGDGVYKSTDAGKTWTHVGLEDTRHIARVRVHPADPNTVWVAALGHVYGPDENRGVYKSTDGGDTWRKMLYVDERSGAVDLCLDPNDPDVIFAATWEAWRTPYELNSGGPGSRLYKSTDGGETWENISDNPGLPEDTLGKIGVSVSGADSNRVYAIIEALDGGVFRSDDAGATWTRVDDDRSRRQRAWYYTRIYADPNEVDTVYVLNVGFYRSKDGGKTWSGIGVPHSDNHDLWIDPENSKRMINANDGGGNVSFDGGESWSEQDFATAQLYHVSTDNAFPYNILGAQQDNSTVRIASRAQGAIDEDAWSSTAGGESGFVVAKPDQPEIVFGGSYGGYLEMLNHETGASRNVNAWPDNPMGHGAVDLAQRFQWTFPIAFSQHDPDVLYTSSQYLLRSTDLGASWQRISPDLTRDDESRMASSGGPITKDNTSIEYYGTIFTIAESPLNPAVIWTGSDDGLIHVTRDAGATWTNVTPGDIPEWGLVSMVEASHHDPATAYAAVDNHENDDHAPYIYITRDWGQTWELAVDGIADDEFLRVVREDPVEEGLLFAGTEMGVWVSFDGGEQWESIQLDLPLAPVHDIDIKGSDVVIATHGRSFWVLDDISYLRQLEGYDAGDVELFDPPPAYRVRWGGTERIIGGGSSGPGPARIGPPPDPTPTGANPESGAIITYSLPRDYEDLKVTITDRWGEEFFSLKNAGDAGLHRLPLWLSYPSYASPKDMIFWAAGARPITAPPGTYTVTLRSGDEVLDSAQFEWRRDPRIVGSSDAQLLAQFLFARRIADRVDKANQAVYTIRSVREQVEARVEAKPSLRQPADELLAALSAVENEIYQTKNQSGQDPLNYPIKLNNRIASLLGVVVGSDFGPTQQSYEVFAILDGLLQEQLDALDDVLSTQLQRFNERLEDEGLEPIVPDP